MDHPKRTRGPANGNGMPLSPIKKATHLILDAISEKRVVGQTELNGALVG